MDNTIAFTHIYENKAIQLHLESPAQSNEEAEQEFLHRIKELYFQKIKSQFTSNLISSTSKEEANHV